VDAPIEEIVKSREDLDGYFGNPLYFRRIAAFFRSKGIPFSAAKLKEFFPQLLDNIEEEHRLFLEALKPYLGILKPISVHPSDFSLEDIRCIAEDGRLSNLLKELQVRGILHWNKREKSYSLHSVDRLHIMRSLSTEDKVRFHERWFNCLNRRIGKEPSIKMLYDIIFHAKELGELTGEKKPWMKREAFFRRVLVNYADRIGDYDKVVEHSSRILEIGRTLNDKEELATGYSWKGIALARMGDLEGALKKFREALKIAEGVSKDLYNRLSLIVKALERDRGG